MKKLKTKNKHQIQRGREFLNKHIYLKIIDIEVSDKGMIAKGYYYYFHNGNEYILDSIVPALLTWQQISQVESQLPVFKVSNSLKEAIYQRITEFTMLKLQQEGTSNFGIPPSNWEDYVEPTQTN